MKQSLLGLGLWIALAGLAPVVLVGCGDASAQRETQAGTMSLSLTGVSGTGSTYRLRNAIFKISGTAAATASSEDNLSAGSITLELKAGGYLAKLNTGWNLEKMNTDGTFSNINAVLISTNPLPFTVADQQTTPVLFQFNAGDDVVQLGDGRAVIQIGVNDCTTGNCDQDGDGVPAPQDCNDQDPTIFPGAPEICDGRDNNCNALVDEGNVCGGGGGMCDVGSDCNTCINCTATQDCNQSFNACFADPQCSALVDCVNSCMDQACAQNCSNMFPTGLPLYQALFSCAGCACPVSCAGQLTCP